MRFVAATCALLAVFCLTTAQDDPKKGLPFTPDPKQEDVQTPDGVMKALYASISGPVGAPRDWNRFRSLFTREARMGGAYKTREGQIKTFSMDTETYIKEDIEIMMKVGFRESEISRHMDRYGNIAQVFSTYASFQKDDKEPFERGINSVQMIFDGKRWWITSLIWQGEEPGLPVPEQYLGSGG